MCLSFVQQIADEMPADEPAAAANYYFLAVVHESSKSCTGHYETAVQAVKRIQWYGPIGADGRTIGHSHDPDRRVTFLTIALFAASSAMARTRRGLWRGVVASSPTISTVNSGAVFDAQATVSYDRKYVTIGAQARIRG